MSQWRSLGLSSRGFKVLEAEATPAVSAIFNLGSSQRRPALLLTCTRAAHHHWLRACASAILICIIPMPALYCMLIASTAGMRAG